MTQPKLTELLDREAIRDCIYRYCRAVDRRDPDLLATIYWPGADDYHGPFNGPVEQFIPFVMNVIGMQQIMQHHITNILIELLCETAKVESYFVAYQRYEAEPGRVVDLFMGGRYLDRMEKRGDEWRTAGRRVIYDWFREMPNTYDFTTDIWGFRPEPGTQDGNDPVYQWLGVCR